MAWTTASDTNHRSAHRTDRQLRAIIITALLLAFAVRVAVMLAFPNILHPDEIFQVLDPAHKLVFGTGIVPWEFKLGIRSWIFPGAAAAIMAAVSWVSTVPGIATTVIATLMVLSSLSVVYCGTMWGYQARGLVGAICCGLLTATWFELILFAPHTLSEVWAAHVLVVGLYLGAVSGSSPSSTRLFLAGLCFGLTFVLRFHIAPALVVAAFFCARQRPRSEQVIFVLGVCIPVAFAGLLDWVTWRTPFQSIWLNVYVNIFDNVARDFGSLPIYGYLDMQGLHWSGAFMVVVACCAIGASRLPAICAVAVTVFVTMSLIGHKEYRFLYPALVFVPILAGVGTAEIVAWYTRHSGRQRLPLLAACLFWVCTSFLLAEGPAYRPYWGENRGKVLAFRAAAKEPDLCGLGLVDVPWWFTPGTSGLPDRVEIAGPISAGQLLHYDSAFNALIAPRGVSINDSRFTQTACWRDGANRMGQSIHPDICLWERPGRCDGTVAPPSQDFWPDPLASRYRGTCPEGLLCNRLQRDRP